MSKVFERVTLFLSRISSVLLWIIVFLVAFNIVSRKLFTITISGIVEIVQYGMLTVMALSMAHVTLTGGHVSVSIATSKLPKSVQTIIEFVTLMLSAALVSMACYVCFTNIFRMMASGLTTERYKIPMYIVYMVMCFGLATSVITFVFNAFSALLRLFRKEDIQGGEKV